MKKDKAFIIKYSSVLRYFTTRGQMNLSGIWGKKMLFKMESGGIKYTFTFRIPDSQEFEVTSVEMFDDIEKVCDLLMVHIENESAGISLYLKVQDYE